MAEVDHAANAEGIAELAPTTLLIFGNPKAGTHLLTERQQVGIDLPMKLLVWEAADGQVHVAYDDTTYLAERHSLRERREVIGKVKEALAAIAAEATASKASAATSAGGGR